MSDAALADVLDIVLVTFPGVFRDRVFGGHFGMRSRSLGGIGGLCREGQSQDRGESARHQANVEGAFFLPGDIRTGDETHETPTVAENFTTEWAGRKQKRSTSG